MFKISNDGKRISRFSINVRIAHWVNAVSVFMLFITGLPLYSKFFLPAADIFGGAPNTIFLHKVFAVIFLLPTIFMLLTDRKEFMQWTKQITSWNSYDFKFLAEFPKEFFGRKADIPKQDFFNAGQKVNSLLTIFTAILMIISGVIMWYPNEFSKEVVYWAYPLHDLGVALMISVVIGHIYLSIGSPESRASLRGMILGDVNINYAREHHGRWYDEVMKENKKNK